jgi:hypothetical protein
LRPRLALHCLDIQFGTSIAKLWIYGTGDTIYNDEKEGLSNRSYPLPLEASMNKK